VALPESVVTCYSCDQAALADPPPRESILRTEHWRVAHAFGTSLPGWLVVVPLRHVLALDELAEAEGFGHVHFHVVPRMASFADDERGPNVFTFLGRPEAEWVPERERDRIALAVLDAVEKS